MLLEFKPDSVMKDATTRRNVINKQRRKSGSKSLDLFWEDGASNPAYTKVCKGEGGPKLGKEMCAYHLQQSIGSCSCHTTSTYYQRRSL